MKLKKLTALILISTFAFVGCATKTQGMPVVPQGTAQTTTPPPENVPPAVEKEPTPEEIADKIMAEMTMEEKVGQMFFARCPETGAGEEIAKYALGGYILFARDFENKTPETLKSTTASYQQASKIPMLIGVDEEGGSVVRASKFPAFRAEPFKSMAYVSKNGGVTALKADTKEKSQFLKNLGINVNLAPVCDVAYEPTDFIYKRTFGVDAGETTQFVVAIVEEMKANKIGSVVKHFPGYGNNVDTHKGIAIDKRPLEELEQNGFSPFIGVIAAGTDSVLISHNVVEAIDKTMPGSLSPAMHLLLRENFGFNGVVMTDDLAMEGVKSFSEIDTAVLAIIAGNDMLISSSIETQIPAVMESIKTGEISNERIDDSVRRILVWKINLGLI